MNWRRRLRTVEAAVLISFWAVLVRIVPIRRIVGDPPSNRRVEDPVTGDVRNAAQDVRGAIRSAAARLPFRSRCLAQSLAASTMLRRRRVHSTLRIGARQRESFEAHAWVECAGLIVAGEGQVGTYAVMLSRQS